MGEWTTLYRRLKTPQDVQMATTLAIFLLCAEAALCSVLLYTVPYTNIDFEAYVEQVEGFIQGERNYKLIKGGTGPLVYPAGFLYIFTGIYWLSDSGEVFKAQIFFTLVYLATQAVVMALYIRSKAVPPWVMILLCLSKRLHSIYVLRLFNDGIAMLLAYCALWLLVSHHTRTSIVVFSAAVSVKMNVLLMAPPVLLVLLKAKSPRRIIEGVIIGVAFQVFLACPFLLHSAKGYISRSFELSRVFEHVWSVNLKFLPEAVFQSAWLAFLLLAAHLALLWLFVQRNWCGLDGGIWQVLKDCYCRSKGVSLRTDYILLVVFTGNFIGIICARTLHYQFYSWYFHSLPYLLWQITELHTVVRCSLWVVIEFIWNVYPSSSWSSLALMICHVGILLALLYQSQSQPLSHNHPVPNSTSTKSLDPGSCKSRLRYQ